MKPLLVGEMNPYGADPEYALYPLPEHASGGRLARIMGLSRTEYLRRFDRVNLCTGAWSLKAARAAAGAVIASRRPVVVLLGAKVASSFGLDNAPFTKCFVHRESTLYLLPHPSGLNRTWNEPGAVQRARALLSDVHPEVEAPCDERPRDP